LQCRLSPLSLGDISRNPERANDLAGLIWERDLRRRNPGLPAIRPNDTLFFIYHRLARSYDFLFFFIRQLCVWKKVEVRLAYRFGRIAQAERLSLGSAVPDKAALGIFKVNLVRHIIKHH